MLDQPAEYVSSVVVENDLDTFSFVSSRQLYYPSHSMLLYQQAESRKKSNLPPAVNALPTTFLIIQPQCEVSHVAPPFSPWQSTSSTCITIFLK